MIQLFEVGLSNFRIHMILAYWGYVTSYIEPQISIDYLQHRILRCPMLFLMIF